MREDAWLLIGSDPARWAIAFKSPASKGSGAD
jgi:hypothetical protein